MTKQTTITATLALGFLLACAGCKKEEPKARFRADVVDAQIVDGQNYNEAIDSVYAMIAEAHVHHVGRAKYQEGGRFNITLAPVPEEQLNPLSDLPALADALTISDKTAKFGVVTFTAIHSGKPNGMVIPSAGIPMPTPGAKIDLATYIYTDKAVSIRGKITPPNNETGGIINIDVALQQGWNPIAVRTILHTDRTTEINIASLSNLNNYRWYYLPTYLDNGYYPPKKGRTHHPLSMLEALLTKAGTQ